MKTFCVQTLGCRVNHYESEQIASLLRSRGYIQTDIQHARLRIVNTCSVTNEAAAQSRQTARRLVRLPVLAAPSATCATPADPGVSPELARVIAVGCWATSNTEQARKLAGVDAVITHQQNALAELNRLLETWEKPSIQPPRELPNDLSPVKTLQTTKPLHDCVNKSTPVGEVKEKVPSPPLARQAGGASATLGATSLPLLDARQTRHQRAFLKIQDGCDAHCTYCIIPRLRPGVWSKPIADVVHEAHQLVAGGHVELVLTGIFLGAYGQPTALRRRQAPCDRPPLAELVEALCTGVPGLGRLRLSSLEPGDLTPALLAVLRSHPQVTPHFHLPLQSGSDAVLRRMNRQYTRDDFLQMVDRVRAAFDRPALTTDIIVGFDGETEAEFLETLDVARQAGFIHIHAFGFSPREGTSAARRNPRPPPGPLVRERIDQLNQIAAQCSGLLRRSFLGQVVEILIEPTPKHLPTGLDGDRQDWRFGRSERYFGVWTSAPAAATGQVIPVRMTDVQAEYTRGDVP